MSTFASFATRRSALNAPAIAPVTRPGWLARVGRSIWDAMERAGRARARREFDDLAWRYSASQPEFAKELRAAAGRDDRAC